MEKTLVIADTMICEWCGNETDDLERNYVGDMCCSECIDEANEETAIIKTCADIDKLSYNETNKLIHELLPYINLYESGSNITTATKILELCNQIVVNIRFNR